MIISESLADAVWPGKDPLGHRVHVGPAGERTVWAVVQNIAVANLERASRYGRYQVYFPFDQLVRMNAYYPPRDLLVHTSGDSVSLLPALRTIIHEVDPQQAISHVRSLQDIVADQTAPRRDQWLVLGTFSGIAFLLSMTGIYGLLAFVVTARTQELGVRVALGATRRDILGMFLRQGLALGIGGVVLAIPIAYAAARGLGALRFGVYPGDPVIYGSSALLAMLMTLVASLQPAIRASSINPALTLRADQEKVEEWLGAAGAHSRGDSPECTVCPGLLRRAPDRLLSTQPAILDEAQRVNLSPVECAVGRTGRGRRRPTTGLLSRPGRHQRAPTSCFWSSTCVSIWMRRGLTLSFSGRVSRSMPWRCEALSLSRSRNWGIVNVCSYRIGF